MTKHSSATRAFSVQNESGGGAGWTGLIGKCSNPVRRLLRLAFDRRGSSTIALVLVFPALLATTSGAIEMGLYMFEQGRATEATRSAARIAAIGDPVADLSTLDSAPVECESNGGTVSCTGGALASTATFDEMVGAMRAIMPAIGPDNVRVSYEFTGLGSEESGGIKPMVRVRLVGVQHAFIMLRVVPGMPAAITLPDFATSLVGKGYVPPP